MKNSIILEEIVVTGNRIDYFFQVNGKVQKYFKTRNLFLKYNVDVTGIPLSILSIPFVANIAPLAWITDASIHVAELDISFYDCLKNIKKAYQNMFPDVVFKGEVFANECVGNSYTTEREAAQLFSGGLDALATYIRIKDKYPLLITEYGWHQRDINESEVWDQDEAHVVRFAQDNGLQNILIHSNYGTFINAQEIDHDFLKKLGDSWWHGLHHSLAIISAAIPVAFQLKIAWIYIASSFFEGYNAKCASDPTVDNEIKYASGNVFHDGYEINRQEKVQVVVDYCAHKKKYVYLRVCFLKERNCCNCEKCVRTIVGIAAEGENPRNFGFDIPADLSNHVVHFLKENVKYFTPAKIMQWNLAKDRMQENQANTMYPELLEWFLEYDFAAERRSSLLKYRITKFFPIVKRRIRTWLERVRTQNP